MKKRTPRSAKKKMKKQKFGELKKRKLGSSEDLEFLQVSGLGGLPLSYKGVGGGGSD